MPLKEKINDDLKNALKAKDKIRTSCLRMLKASLKNKQVELGREPNEQEILAVISSMVRKGKEAASEFKKGGRDDLALKEDEEIKVFYEYMPEQCSPEEIRQTLQEVIADLSAEGPKDIGKVMKAAMERLAGKAQGKEVNELARQLLT
ncbi:GatB/YqeY domain-containing protein [Thermodesulfobacteriota bacterium]